MTADIFEFWARISPTDYVHPSDIDVLDRVRHGFDLGCLPGCFDGPLRTARVVLLYLSPGFGPEDLREAQTEVGQTRNVERRSGNRPLLGRDEHLGAWTWRHSRTKVFDTPDEIIRQKLAILNIGAYHSTTFEDAPLLAALPSSRVSLDWAQTVLFPQAMAGNRVVVCMRSARFWGLDKATKYGAALFAPPVTRGGHLKYGPERDEIIVTVQKAFAA
jgi:hypothetical protein